MQVRGVRVAGLTCARAAPARCWRQLARSQVEGRALLWTCSDLAFRTAGTPASARPTLSQRAEATASNIPGAATVYVRTFGCAHNVSDGETMAGLLEAAGYRVVGDKERGKAHAWVVNSCTVKGPSQVRD